MLSQISVQSLAVLALQSSLLLSAVVVNAQGGLLTDLLAKFTGNQGATGGSGAATSPLVETLDKLLAGGKNGGGLLGSRNKCLAEEERPSATVGEITKGMSFYLDMEPEEAEELKRTASCLIDAYTPEKANAHQLCTYAKPGQPPAHAALRDYMLECDDVVHFRVLGVNAGGGATVGCVVSLSGQRMWANPAENLELRSATEDFEVVDEFKCGSKYFDDNLKRVSVLRRLCFVTRNQIMNRDLTTGERDRKCDVTQLQLVAQPAVRGRIVDCAVDAMTSPRQNPDEAINKCRCFERAPFRRVVDNCTSQVENPDRCQDLESASLAQKFSLGYLGSCLRNGGLNAFGSDERGDLSCLAQVRTGKTATDDRLVAGVRDFLISCDQRILNTVYNSADGCVYQVADAPDSKWTAPQNTKITRDFSQSSQAETAQLIEKNRVFECPRGARTSAANVRQENQNRQLLNLWRTSCNVVQDLLTGPAESCAPCRFAVLQRMAPELAIAPKGGRNPKTLDAYAKNVFDCVRGLMDQWYSDPSGTFINCLDKELDGINPDIC